MLQQLSLLTAGAQPWNYNICSVHHRKFAYAATLVIYVYQAEAEFSEWLLCSILADHRKTITCIDWHPNDEDILASSSADHCIRIWSVSQQSVMQAVNICRVPILVFWCCGVRDILSFATQTGPIQVWYYTSDVEPSSFREEHSYSSDIVTYAWHPSVPRRLIIGHEDGRLTLYREDTNKVKHAALFAGLEEGECHPTKIKTLAWDYNSPDYLLIAYHEGQLWLIDVSSFRIITKFIMPVSSSVATLAWLPDVPGMFVTGDCEKGVLRIWSVSKKTPLENCSLKDTGFHCLCIPLTSYKCPYNSGCDISSSNIHSLDEKGPVIPNVSVLSLFKDGGIGIYHLKRKEWIFNREHGHTETIFDCSFKPDDCDILATGSFDGSIKIWRVDTMEAVETLPNRNAIIYSVSWAPADLNCIVAGTSTGGVFIWNIKKRKIIQDFKMHKDKMVFCVAWNMKDSRKIASVGESCYCYVHQVNGVNGLLVQSYKHPGPVYGCHWRDEDLLATGCDDGRIRIYNVNKSSKEPVLDLKAHQQKVFGVKWNPVYEDILCSGSDDTSIKIWSYSKAQCLSVLAGHADNVRGLVWCPEVPSLLISGSWDRTMRVWDAKSCTCLDTVFDHRADVYGLSIHPVRPFMLASCSRDSTVRLWSIASIVAPLQLRVLAGRPIEEIIVQSDPRGSFDPKMRLCGLRADHLLSTINKIEEPLRQIRSLKLFADIFCVDLHIRNLWDLVYVLLGVSELSSLSPQYSSSIVHHSHLMKCALSSASEKEANISKSKSISNLRASVAEGQESLVNLYLSCGALQQYCELMVKLKKWDHAIALAPAVSVDYWRQLIERHANDLLLDDSEACVPYLLASKATDKLVQFHIMRGHLDKALSASIMASQIPVVSRKASLPAPPVPPRGVRQDTSNEVVLSDRLIECAHRMAACYLKKGSPVCAACTLLAVDDIEGGLKVLLQGHEIDLTVVIGQMLKEKKSLTANQRDGIENLISIAKRYLVYRAIRMSSFDLALDIAKSVTEEEERSLLVAEVVIWFSGNCQEKESLYNDAGLTLPDNHEGGTESDETDYDKILRGLLSDHPQKGLAIGVDILKECVTNGNVNRVSLWRILRLLQSVPLCQSSSGTLNAKTELKAMMLAYSSFFGAIKADALRYSSLVIPLLDHSRLLIEKYNSSELGFLTEVINQLKSKYEAGDATLGYDLSEISGTWLDTDLMKISGSHLPRHSENHICCITNQIIKGPVFFLEDEVSVIGLNDALMWAKVHPYSPLGTGQRLNPF